MPTSNPRPKLLLVDDEPANLLALEAVLAPLKQRLVRASSGMEALRHLLNDDFAVILLDVRMPGMDGYELARRIRSQEALGGRRCCLVIALTASAEKDALERCLAAGMDRVLFKPTTLDELARALNGGEPLMPTSVDSK